MPLEPIGPARPASRLRAVRVGDRVPATQLGPMPSRRLAATVLLLPGSPDPTAYRAALEESADAFAGWDGRVRVAEPDGQPAHRLLVVDRYRHVYAVHDATGPGSLPDVDALTEWFRFLATACPECGVLDDPLLAGPTP